RRQLRRERDPPRRGSHQPLRRLGPRWRGSPPRRTGDRGDPARPRSRLSFRRQAGSAQVRLPDPRAIDPEAVRSVAGRGEAPQAIGRAMADLAKILLERLKSWTYEMAGPDSKARIEKLTPPANEYGVDPYGFDMNFATSAVAPLLWLYRNYFRVQVS